MCWQEFLTVTFWDHFLLMVRYLLKNLLQKEMILGITALLLDYRNPPIPNNLI